MLLAYLGGRQGTTVRDTKLYEALAAISAEKLGPNHSTVADGVFGHERVFQDECREVLHRCLLCSWYQHKLPVAQRWQVETMLFEGYLYNAVDLFLASKVLCPS